MVAALTPLTELVEEFEELLEEDLVPAFDFKFLGAPFEFSWGFFLK